jgi:hypothetical protein
MARQLVPLDDPDLTGTGQACERVSGTENPDMMTARANLARWPQQADGCGE